MALRQTATNYSTTLATLTANFGMATLPGSAIVVVAACDVALTVDIQDASGNTFQNIGHESTAVFACVCKIATNANAISSVSALFSGSGTHNRVMIAREYSVESALDLFFYEQFTGTNPNVQIGTNSDSNETLIGWGVEPTNSTMTVGAGFGNLDGITVLPTGGVTVYMEDKALSAIGLQTVSFGSVASATYAIGGLTLKNVGGTSGSGGPTGKVKKPFTVFPPYGTKVL